MTSRIEEYLEDYTNGHYEDLTYDQIDAVIQSFWRVGLITIEERLEYEVRLEELRFEKGWK